MLKYAAYIFALVVLVFLNTSCSDYAFVDAANDTVALDTIDEGGIQDVELPENTKQEVDEVDVVDTVPPVTDEPDAGDDDDGGSDDVVIEDPDQPTPPPVVVDPTPVDPTPVDPAPVDPAPVDPPTPPPYQVTYCDVLVDRTGLYIGGLFGRDTDYIAVTGVTECAYNEANGIPGDCDPDVDLTIIRKESVTNAPNAEIIVNQNQAFVIEPNPSNEMFMCLSYSQGVVLSLGSTRLVFVED